MVDAPEDFFYCDFVAKKFSFVKNSSSENINFYGKCE
jgi:hypothetical protein